MSGEPNSIGEQTSLKLPLLFLPWLLFIRLCWRLSELTIPSQPVTVPSSSTSSPYPSQ